MIPKIESIKVLDNYTIFVAFKDGKKGLYDVGEDIEQIKQFEDLKNIHGLFKNAQIDESRTVIFWNDMIDLPSDTIYEHLKECD